jgi:ATP-dependent Clp protease ATP-binding subunit ClpX
LLVELLDEADGNLSLAERGIIALDEFDKLVSHEGGLEIKDAVQQELLHYIGGGKHPIEYKGRKITFDTSKVTFIGIGAFTALRERKIKENSENRIGFIVSDKPKDRTYKITMQDYINEGLQKELVARFALPVHTNHFTKEDLFRIAKKSKISPINSLIENGKLYGVEIVIGDEIIDKIVNYAIEEGFEARSLNDIVTNLKNVLLSSMISSRVDRVVVNEEILNKSRNYMIRSY